MPRLSLHEGISKYTFLNNRLWWRLMIGHCCLNRPTCCFVKVYFCTSHLIWRTGMLIFWILHEQGQDGIILWWTSFLSWSIIDMSVLRIISFFYSSLSPSRLNWRHIRTCYVTHLLRYRNVIRFQIIKKKKKKRTYRISISETTFDGILKICFVRSRWSKSRKKSTRVFLPSQFNYGPFTSLIPSPHTVSMASLKLPF